jgi:predicted anti-sigma-YlaC factor YlaD
MRRFSDLRLFKSFERKHVMRPCRRIRKKMSAFQDGEIEAAQKETFETHLRSCASCRRYYENLQEIYQILGRLPEIKAGASLSLGIFDRVSQPREPLRLRIKNYFWLRLPVPAAMVVLAAAGLWVGVLAGHFWIAQGYLPLRTAAAFQPDQVVTLSSVKAFDAAPAGSFAAGYLQLTTHSETRHAK